MSIRVYNMLQAGVDALIIREGKVDNFARLLLAIFLYTDSIRTHVMSTNQTEYFSLISNFRRQIIILADTYLDYREIYKNVDSTLRKMTAIANNYDELSSFKKQQAELTQIKSSDSHDLQESKEKLAQKLDIFFPHIDSINILYTEANKK
jgi:hypothetical protein